MKKLILFFAAVFLSICVHAQSETGTEKPKVLNGPIQPAPTHPDPTPVAALKPMVLDATAARTDLIITTTDPAVEKKNTGKILPAK
jgi:hypothetical protein